MKDLARAFAIFNKYTDGGSIACEHDVLYVFVDYDTVSVEDVAELEYLGFQFNDDGGEGFMKYV